LAAREGVGFRNAAGGYLGVFRETVRGMETGGVLVPE